VHFVFNTRLYFWNLYSILPLFIPINPTLWKFLFGLYIVHDPKYRDLGASGQWTKKIFFCIFHSFRWSRTYLCYIPFENAKKSKIGSPTLYSILYVISDKNPQKALGQHHQTKLSMAWTLAIIHIRSLDSNSNLYGVNRNIVSFIHFNTHFEVNNRGPYCRLLPQRA
jgi:hypothetical protein